jgi:hypothetical protein
MSDLYLIAHKVRGAPAFDIAHRLQIGDEEGWVIPTSGHRAYPYWTQPLEKLQFYDEAIGQMSWPGEPAAVIPPPDWPDHYSCNDRPARRTVASLLELVGLAPRPADPIKRRV